MASPLIWVGAVGIGAAIGLMLWPPSREAGPPPPSTESTAARPAPPAQIDPNQAAREAALDAAGDAAEASGLPRPTEIAPIPAPIPADAPDTVRSWSPEPPHWSDRHICTEARASGQGRRRVAYVSSNYSDVIDDPTERQWRSAGCDKGAYREPLIAPTEEDILAAVRKGEEIAARQQAEGP